LKIQTSKLSSRRQTTALHLAQQAQQHMDIMRRGEATADVCTAADDSSAIERESSPLGDPAADPVAIASSLLDQSRGGACGGL
jgi:hypothetical protein